MRGHWWYLIFVAPWFVIGHAWGVELSVPLRTYSSHGQDFVEVYAGTVPINSVFDHFLTGEYYDRDEYITAFSGERAWSASGENTLPACAGSYRQDYPVPFGSFFINGQYKAASCGDIWLLYDGHPALDFRAPTGTVIYAPASGTVSEPAIDPIYRYPQSLFNMLKVDHGDGWNTLYLHCASHMVTSGFVTRGTPIATVGDVGSAGFPHLHFEVRHNDTPVDPYGWQGTGPDPYTNEINHHLWAEAIQASGDNRVYLLRRTYSDARGQWETRKWWVTTQSGGDDSQFFQDIGYSVGYIKMLDPAVASGYADGPNVLSPSSLYRRPYFADGAVYYIGDDRQSHYVSASVFAAWGFDNGDVYVCDSSTVFNTVQADYYPVGAPLAPPGGPTATPSPTSTPTPIQFDVDCDGFIGAPDLLNFLQGWHQSAQQQPYLDLDDSGRIDYADVCTVSTQWTPPDIVETVTLWPNTSPTTADNIIVRLEGTFPGSNYTLLSHWAWVGQPDPYGITPIVVGISFAKPCNEPAEGEPVAFTPIDEPLGQLPAGQYRLIVMPNGTEQLSLSFTVSAIGALGGRNER